MRLPLAKHLSSPRRRWQILLICLILIIINLTSSMVYHQQTKPSAGDSTKRPVIVEPKTVSYHEIPPEIIDSGQDDAYISTTTTRSSSTTKKSTTFPEVYNPWFSDHVHGNNDDQLNLIYGQDYENATINSCSYRVFKNNTVFSHAEFIHDYIAYKNCVNRNKLSNLDLWTKSVLKAETGPMGNILIESKLNFRQRLSEPCDHSDLSVVIVVLSRSKTQRDNIRATWGKTLPSSVKVFFLVPKLDQIEGESEIIQTDIEENDPDFEFKQTLATFIWLHQTCPRARFVLKTTSDTFINVAKVIQLINQEMYASNRMYGELLRRLGPAWEPDDLPHHHQVAKEEWPWAKYPPFLKGPSFVVSGDLVPRMLVAVTVIPTLSLAQVFFTGLVPLMGHMIRIGVSSFFAYYPPPLDTEDPCEFTKFGGIHRMTELEQMKTALEKAEETIARNETCSVAPRCLAMVEGKCMMFSKDYKSDKKKEFKWP